MKPDNPTRPETADSGAPPARRKRSRAHKAGLWSVGTLSVLVIGICIGVLMLIGQTLSAPDWLRTRVQERISQNSAGLQVQFGEVQVVMLKGWLPRIRLSDVALADASGRPILRLSDAEASLAFRPLLNGQIVPEQIVLTGAYATLRRDSDGAFALSFTETGRQLNRAANLPELVERLDSVLELPALSALNEVTLRSLSLRYEDARHGRAWNLDGGQIEMTRQGDDLNIAGSLALLSGRDYATSIEVNYFSRIGQADAKFGVSVQDVPAEDIAVQSVALAWMQVLRAPISGSLRGGVNEAGKLGPLSATLQIGAGVVQPTEQARPIPFDGARSYFTYEPDSGVLTFDELSVESAWVTGIAEGRAYLEGVAQGRLSELIGQFNLTGLTLNPQNLFPEPITLENVAADFRLKLAPFQLTLGQMHVTRRQSRIRLSGELGADQQGWDLAVDGGVDRITPQDLLEIWPETVAPKPRAWVQANLTAGRLQDIRTALRIVPGEQPVIHAALNFDDAMIRFMRTMPPISKAAGQASLFNGRLAVTAMTGQIETEEHGAMDVSGTSFIIPDIGVKPDAPAIVRVRATGPVTTVLSLLNRKPLEVLKGTPLPVDMAEGGIAVEGTIALPISDNLDFSDITFHARGTVSDLSTTQLVPGQTLTAKSLEIVTDQTTVRIGGAGLIGPVPVKADWVQAIGKGVEKRSRVIGQIELSPRLVDTMRIGLPRGTVSGQGQGDFTLYLGTGSPPLLAVRSDLEGVGLTVAPLGWTKPQATTGLLIVEGELGEVARIDRLVVQGAGLSATGTVINKADGGLDRALLSSVRLDDWLDASVELVGRAGAAAPDLEILGGTLDLRRATFGDGEQASGGAASSGRINVRLDRLQVADSLALTGFSGEFTTAGGLAGPYRGMLNGQVEVAGIVQPKDGRTAVRVLSNDAGRVFSAAGILTQGRGGSFDMSLSPTGQEGAYDGSLKVRDTRIQDAPAIAALLNSASVVGLLDEMAGQGIQFSEAEARFGLTPSKLTIYSSSAIGPSIGLSMDGTYDLSTNNLDMRGVISPVYLINQIGSVLTRKGEGVFGFNYTLTGSAADPTVSVNPLSALTPGMLRNMFREPPPTQPGAEKPEPSLRTRRPATGSGTGGVNR